MKKLSKGVHNTEHSGIRKMFNMALEMQDTVSFAVGEPDFSAPQRVVDAANKCNQDGITKYTHNAGILPLRQRISKKLVTYGAHEYDPATEIIVASGATEALWLTLSAILDEGDEAILGSPYWSNYMSMLTMLMVKPKAITLREENKFVLDPAEVRAAVTPKTKVLIITSPSNPTGGVAPREVLEELAQIVIENDLYVISDEVYRNFLYDGLQHSSISTLPGMRERTIVIDSFSKSYAMTGWRIGYAAGPASVIDACIMFHENTSSCANTAAQYGAIAALDGEQPGEMEATRQIYDRRRKLIVNGINALPYLSCIMPLGAFYAFPNITATGLKSEEFCVRLLKETGVVTVPGTAFGASGEGYIRLSYATSEANIEEGLRRMKGFLEKL